MNFRFILSAAGGYMLKIGICMFLFALVILTARVFGAVRVPMTGGGILLIFLSGKGRKK